MHDVADVAQIFAERRRALRLWRRQSGSRRNRRRRVGRLRPTKKLAQKRRPWHRRRGVGKRSGSDFLFGRRRRPRDFRMLHVEPLVALRWLAAGAARAIRIAERQAHFVGEIGAQEVDEIGAIGTKAGLRIILAATQIVEQEIARLVVQHFMPRLPGQVLVGRRVKQLLDPRRKQRFRCAIPIAADLPENSRRRTRRLRLARAHGDLAGDRAALRGRVIKRQCRVPRARGRLGDFGEPGIRCPAAPAGRFGTDASVGRDQREHALKRLLGDEHDSQWRALPWRDWRGHDRKLSRVLAGA